MNGRSLQNAVREPGFHEAAVRVVAVAASAGGLAGLKQIVSCLSPEFNASVIVVQHASAERPPLLVNLLQHWSAIPVEWAAEGKFLAPGRVFVAPGGCHLRLNDSCCFTIDRGGRINYVWPCADVLFESLAATLGPRALGVVLSGLGNDGAAGLRAIRNAGGVTIVEDSCLALYPSMPEHARGIAHPDLVLASSQIGVAIEALIAEDHRRRGDTYGLHADIKLRRPRRT